MEVKKDKIFCDEVFYNGVVEYSFEEIKTHKWKRKLEEQGSIKALQEKVDLLQRTIEDRVKEVEELKKKINEIVATKEKEKSTEKVADNVFDKENLKVKEVTLDEKLNEVEKPTKHLIVDDVDKENMVQLIKEIKTVKDVSQKDDLHGNVDETSSFSVFVDISAKSNGTCQVQSLKQPQPQTFQNQAGKAESLITPLSSKAEITVIATNQSQILPGDQTRRKSLVKPKLSTLVEDSREGRSSTNPSSSSQSRTQSAPKTQIICPIAPPLQVSQPSQPFTVSSQNLPPQDFIKPTAYVAVNSNPPPSKRIPLTLRPDPAELVDFSINPAIHRGSTCFRMSEGFSIFLPNETECLPKQASTPDGKNKDKEN